MTPIKQLIRHAVVIPHGATQYQSLVIHGGLLHLIAQWELSLSPTVRDVKEPLSYPLHDE